MMLLDLLGPQIGTTGEYSPLVVVLVKALVIILVLITCAAYLTLAERKVAARIQLRIGPDRVGPFGLLQPADDAVKMLFKENVAPAGRDRLLYLIAPSIAAIAAFTAFGVIPVNGSQDSISDQPLHWNIAHLNVGLLFVLAVTSLGVYSIFLGGWAANSKYSLLGALRSSAQLISYEMAVAFALMGVVILSGSLDLERVVEQQQASHWFVLMQPLAFVLYFIGALAETNRLPFDMAEAETELVGGYHTEYSGMKFGLYFLGEYINMITVCSIATVMFLGGWLSPITVVPFTWVPGVLWFFLKVFLLLFVMMWIRWTLPRLRYDRLMEVGWKVLIPASLVWLILAGAAMATGV